VRPPPLATPPAARRRRQQRARSVVTKALARTPLVACAHTPRAHALPHAHTHAPRLRARRCWTTSASSSWTSCWTRRRCTPSSSRSRWSRSQRCAHAHAPVVVAPPNARAPPLLHPALHGGVRRCLVGGVQRRCAPAARGACAALRAAARTCAVGHARGALAARARRACARRARLAPRVSAPAARAVALTRPRAAPRRAAQETAGGAGGAGGADDGDVDASGKRRVSGAKGASKKARTDGDAPARSPTRDLLPLMTGGEMRDYQARTKHPHVACITLRSRTRMRLRTCLTRECSRALCVCVSLSSAPAAEGRAVDDFAVPERAERHPGGPNGTCTHTHTCTLAARMQNRNRHTPPQHHHAHTTHTHTHTPALSCRHL
jgi:hypothetical protein